MENRVERVVFLDMPKTRVYLRPIEKGDLPFFRQALNDENIAKFLQVHYPLTETEEEAWFQDLPKRKENNRHCSIVLKENNEVIGSIGLHNIDWVSRTATTGTFIGKEELCGKGLGTEAKMLWLKYAFFTLNLRQVYSCAYSFNERSVRYSIKCGYKEIARFPEALYRCGKYHDTIHLVVIRETWEPLWKKFEEEFV